MARITVEDCLSNIPNRFDLAQVATKRARQLARGAEATLPWADHKSTVLALQEIAHGSVDASVLDEADLPVIRPPDASFEPLDIIEERRPSWTAPAAPRHRPFVVPQR